MTPPIDVQEELDKEESVVESQRRTVKQVKQKQQEQRERKDSNGNIIKEKPESEKSAVLRRLWSALLSVLKKPVFRPSGRKASYNFGDYSTEKKKKVKRHWWSSRRDVQGRQRQLSAVIADNVEPKEKDIPVRYRSADCL